jgi:hypothetical protein
MCNGPKKKMRKSFNEQDFSLCGIVVCRSPPSHAAATRAQAIPAVIDAPAVLTITSVATAPTAASDSTVTVFTEYDKNIEFDHVVDDGG